MAKQRKTRQEKIAIQNKRQESGFTYSFSHVSKTQEITHTNTSPYGYVVLDIRKTFMVSITLVVLQLILFLLLQHRVVTIPGVTY